MNKVLKKKARFEHRFWLQILGDHSRFIYNSLAPSEIKNIDIAAGFIKKFDTLLKKAESEDALQLTIVAEEETVKFRAFKLDLLEKHLLGKVKIHLSPTFINHMVNELEEYLLLLKHFKSSEMPPIYHELHHHLVWLLDAAGHAGAISSNLDPVEKRMKEKSDQYSKHFEGLYLKAVEMVGYLRTNLTIFPALEKMNVDVTFEMNLFRHFLHELEELELSAQALGTFFSLMADHMAREECYYLMKLAESTNIEMPNCDPAKPRIIEKNE